MTKEIRLRQKTKNHIVRLLKGPKRGRNIGLGSATLWFLKDKGIITLNKGLYSINKDMVPTVVKWEYDLNLQKNKPQTSNVIMSAINNIKKESIRKDLVRLLKGPLKCDKLIISSAYLSTMKKKGILTHDRTKGLYRLSPDVIPVVTKWDYELKVKNNHPDQDTPVISKAIVLPVDDTTKDTDPSVLESYNDALAKAEKIIALDQFSGDMKMVTKEPEAIDWQLRHTEFLEEVVRGFLAGNGSKND